ncbi:hypothetical protein [Castellaniella sp.]|uniref:hypothetical protein n=1 Tax=Castellaniella sp. TaxID=1955812 RepID=UPI002AFEE420|nr:hypothetical protein [Castellaniella sp.]
MNKNQGKQMGKPKTRRLPAPAGGIRMETFIPWTLIKRGAKKEVITPLDAPQAFRVEAERDLADAWADGDTPLLRALGLAHHWQRLLDEGRFQSLTQIARAEGLDIAQVSRISRLAGMSPRRVEQIAQCSGGIRAIPQKGFPALWSQQ